MKAGRGRRYLWQSGLFFAAAVLLAAGYAPPRAAATVYWLSSGGHVGVVNQDGSEELFPLPAGYAPGLETGNSCGLEVDAAHLYWADPETSSIGRANLDGTEPVMNFVTGLGAPCGVAVDANYVYWADRQANAIGRARLDGSHVEPAFIVGADLPTGVAVEAAHIYWSNAAGGTIGRANLDGSGVDQNFIEAPEPLGIAVGGGYLYWGGLGHQGTIGRADLNGGFVQPNFIAAAGDPWDLAVDGTDVYWINQRFWDMGGALGRASLDGTRAEPGFLDPLNLPTGVAVDGRVRPPKTVAPRPSDYIRLGRMFRVRGSSALTLPVYVPARGEFTVDSAGIGWRIDKGNPPPYVGGTFTWMLRLWPGLGANGRRLRHRLRKRGKVRFALRVTYQQEGRLPLEASKSLVFLRAGGR